MQDNIKKQHWEEIYKGKDTTREVSWYQANPKTSLDLILSTTPNKAANIIDIGGGDSRFADELLELDFKNLFVLDISAEALAKTKARLGDKVSLVNWIESDILEFVTKTRFDIWHDRAAFHFLTEKKDIIRYVGIASKLIKPNGHLIVSTFATSGPKKCSGLDIMQYSEDSIRQTFGQGFDHIKSFEETHTTPFDTKQAFLWSVFRRATK